MDSLGNKKIILKGLVFFSVLMLINPVFSQVIDQVNPNSTVQDPNVIGQETLWIYGIDTHFSGISSYNQIRLVQGTTQITAAQLLFIPPDQDELMEITFEFSPSLALGYYDLYVTTPADGLIVKENAFYIYPWDYAPQIISITPESGVRNQMLNVTITGEHTHFGQGSSETQIWFSQGSSTVYAQQVEAVDLLTSNAQFTFTDSHPSGLYDISIYNNYDATVTKSQAFMLQGDPSEPHLVDVEPNHGLQGTYLEVTITAQGTSFSQGSGTVWFTQGSSTAIYPLQYSASDDETITGFFNLGNNPTGLYNVNTSSAEGHLVLPNSFEVLFNPNMPEIVSVDPNIAEQGQSLSVSITGDNTHFGQGTSTTQVWFSQASGTTIYSADVNVNSVTEIVADFEFGYGSNYPPGLYDVWVLNSIDNALVKNGGFLLQQGSNPPEISSVTPDEACKGSQVQLTVSGNNLNFQEAASNNLNVWLQISNTNYYQIYPTDIQIINDNQIVANFDIGNWVDAWFYDLMLYSEYTGYLVYSDAVFINSEPELLPKPVGVSSLCVNPPNINYSPSIGGDYNATEYLWLLEPANAGTIVGEGFQIQVDWENSFTGLAQLSIAGVNDCGIGLYSNPLEISIADNPTIAGFTFSNYGGMIQFNNTSQYADDFYWEFGDGETSTDAFPMHAYPEDGYYTVTLHASGGSCGSDTYSEEIYINYTTIVESSLYPFNLYPNPVTSVLFFNKNVNTVEVFNINGQKIQEQTNTSKVNFDAISAGIYIVKIQDANQIFTRRVIKQ